MACMYALLLFPLFPRAFALYREQVSPPPCLDWDTIHASGFYSKGGESQYGEVVRLKIYILVRIKNYWKLGRDVKMLYSSVY